MDKKALHPSFSPSRELKIIDEHTVIFNGVKWTLHFKRNGK